MTAKPLFPIGFVLLLFAAWMALNIEPTVPAPRRAVAVIDGDTFELGEEKIRLAGIDAPELRQTCRSLSGAEWPCGQIAADRLESLTASGGGEVVEIGRKRARR